MQALNNIPNLVFLKFMLIFLKLTKQTINNNNNFTNISKN
jgi:hypothetical protein